ncbi:MAG: hypothetical protein QOI35_497 [Cryptosporangiaceae bacterium]|jgi:phage shock protein PspC (stress-responsive transcriptional regulator)|nr:hypothetical protein [Cryptosporangiaceae bacterium]
MIAMDNTDRHDGGEGPADGLPPADDTPPAAETAGGTHDAPPPGAATPPPPPPPPGAGPGLPPPGPAAPPPGATGYRPPLYRSRDQKIIAGVCGGLARATGTDPILFRVLLGVLAFAGGLGVALYLVAWLLLPMDGEAASPVEALLGRGTSSLHPVATVLLGLVAAFTLISLFRDFWTVALLLAALAGLALLLQRSGALPQNLAGSLGFGPRPQPGTPGGYAPPPATPWSATAEAPPYAPPQYGQPQYGQPQYGGPPLPPPPPYAPPYAPHGPFARRAATLPPPPPPVGPKPPKPPKQRSVLGRITFSLICLSLAALGIADLSGASITATVYVATALGVTGIGLVVGTWFGRSRLLILLGLVLALAATLVGAGQRFSHDDRWHHKTLWTPASLSAVQPDYQADSGDATLDLRGIDFTDTTTPKAIHVDLGAGTLRVMLPPKVDVTVASDIGVGTSRVLGTSADGLGLNRTTTDEGTDGPGGGTLDLDLKVGAGTLEVVR